MPYKNYSSTSRVIILLNLFFLFSFSWTTSHSWGAEKKPYLQTLRQLTSLPEYQTGTSVFFLEQFPEKNQAFRSMFSKYKFDKKFLIGAEPGDTTQIFSIHDSWSIPNIEFRKINPTKYRLRIHKARQNFPLILSESFNDNWELYLVPWTAEPAEVFKKKSLGLLSSYRAQKNIEEIQASRTDLENFIKSGLVTDLSYEPDSHNHIYQFISSSLKTPPPTFETSFISKNFQGTIQNDNLAPGKPWETWGSENLIVGCVDNITNHNGCPDYKLESWQVLKENKGKAILWPNILHWPINGYANSWWITLNLIKRLPSVGKLSHGYFKLNSDDSIDFEVIIEYWPQQLFYLGWGVTIFTFLLCIFYIIFRGFISLVISKN